MRVQARLVLTDFSGELPLVNAIEFSLLEIPDIYWDLGGAASIAKTLIKQQLKFVLANKLVIPLASSKASDLNIPVPEGYVKVAVEKCRSLEGSRGWIEKLVGSFKSSERWVNRNNPAAELNSTCEIPVENPDGRILHLKVLGEKSLDFKVVELTEVVSGRVFEQQRRGLCGSAAQILMSARWCPVRELTGLRRSWRCPGCSPSLSSVSSVPSSLSISLALTEPGLAGTQYRQAWKSKSIKREAKAAS